MILEFDIGNTRIKWRQLLAETVVARGAVSHGDDWQSGIVRQCNVAPQRLRVANVAGAEIAGQVAHWAQAQWQIIAEFADSTIAVAGAKHVYAQPERLGVDRWLTILAARRLLVGASIIVDVGSAMTLDVVSEAGLHLGGYILPGLEMQRQALFGATSEVKVAEQFPQPCLGLGTDTNSAVINGGLVMALGVIERAVRDFPQATMLVTGGDAAVVVPFLPKTARHCPELVMDGLVVMMP